MAQKFYLRQNVYDAAKERIAYLLDEFDDFVVGFSGGKDSTICLNLTIEVAREKGKLPVKVLFLDQEAEWDTVIDYVRRTMNRDEVEPLWFQIPLKLFNSTSTTDMWLECWEPDKEWIRPKEPNSIKENHYGTDRFAELFTKIFEKDFADRTICYIAGVRAEESPTRMMGLTEGQTYKHITWGKYLNKKLGHYTFYPLYDWSYTDVWKAIHDNDWDYCEIYDYMYQHGVPVRDMRVSNVHHETAVKSLYYLQEIEADNWNRIVKRIKGINTAGMIKEDAFYVKELPFMFKSWREYRDYLLDNLIEDKENHATFKKNFDKADEVFTFDKSADKSACKVAITSILKNDYHMTTFNNFLRSPEINTYKKYKSGKITKIREVNKHLEDEYGSIIYVIKD